MADNNLSLPQTNYSLEDRIMEDSVNMNPIKDSTPYNSIEDMFPDVTDQVSEDYRNRIASYKTLMDVAGPSAIANMGVADMPTSPGLASSTFPQKELPISEQMDQLWSKPLEQPQGSLPSPIWDNVRNLNFDRQYASDKFSDIGFTPYADMDATFNANTTGYDGFLRGWSAFGNLFGTGLYSQWRSLTDIGDGYFESPDLQGAMEMEDAMRIGGSTSGSFMGKAGNLGLNFAYTAGVVTSIAIEELAVAAASALGTIPSGGASWAAFLATTVKNANVLRKLKNTFTLTRGASAGRNLLTQINKIENARDFFAAGKGILGSSIKFIAPETQYAIKNWKTTGNTAQNLFNISKNTELFGGFYRDLRAINATMAEAKLESGMVYNQVLNNGLNYANAENLGSGVTNEQQQKIMINASKAAFQAQMANAAIIYTSNKFVLKTALGGWQRKLGKETTRVLRQGPGQYLKSSKWLLKRIPQELKKGIKLSGWKGVAKVGASQMLRYGSANLAEGVQEVAQEAVSSATVGYYSSLLRDPIQGGPSTLTGYISQGIDEQFTMQGLETFAGGFFMGGLAGPYQQILFSGMPAISRYSQSAYNKSQAKDGESYSDPYKEYKQKKEEVIDDIVSTLNQRGEQMNSSLEVILNPTQLAASLQKQIAGEQNVSIAINDRKDFNDKRNLSEFDNLYKSFQNGSIKFLREDLVNYNKLTDKELLEAFPKSQIGRSAKSLRKKINSQINTIDQFGESIAKRDGKLFQDSWGVDTNKIDSNLEVGTIEYRDAYFKQKANRHAEYLYMFTTESFKNAVKRQADIETSLETDPILAKQSYSDIRVLFNKETVKSEIDILDKEIQVMNDSSEAKDLVAKKKKKRAALKKYYAVLSDPKNVTQKGFYSRAAGPKKNIKAAFKNYIQTIAENNDDFVNQEIIDETIEKLVDHSALAEDAAGFSRSIDYLSNPEGMQAIADRTEEYYKFLYKNRTTVYKKQAEGYIDAVRKNQLLNDIAKLDVSIETEFVREFLTGEKTIQDLIIALTEGKFFINGRAIISPGFNRNLNIKEDKELLNKITAILLSYSATQIQDKIENEEVIIEETEFDLNVKLQDKGINIDIGDVSNSQILNTVLENQYRKYRANIQEASDILPFEDWKATNDGVKIITAFETIKKVWASGYQITVTEFGEERDIKKIPTKEEIKSEKGFQEYLNSKEAIEEPLIADILISLGLPINLFTTKDVVQIGEVLIPIEGGEGISFNIIPVKTEDGTFYQIQDKNGNPLTDQMLELISKGVRKQGSYNNLAEAKADLAILDNAYSDGSTFMFDGKPVSKGMSVYDVATGEEFIINSTNARSGAIGIVPSSFYTSNFNTRKANSILTNETDFFVKENGTGKYELEKIDFDAVSSNVQKYKANDPIKIYPVRDNNKADEALEFISSALTPADVKNLVLRIETNVVEPYAVAGSITKDPNIYVLQTNEDYTISISIENIDTLNKINKALNVAGFDTLKSNVIGYIPNGSISFIDKNKKVVPIETMPLDFAKNVLEPRTINGKKQSIEEALEEAKINYAKANILLSEINGLVSNEVGIGVNQQAKIGDLQYGLEILNFVGVPAFDTNGPLTTLSKLPYTANAAGDILIYDITRDATGNATGKPTVISNLVPDSDAIKALEAEVKDELTENGLWTKMMDGSQAYSERYQYVVRQPNGTYTLAGAKTTQLESERIESMFLKMIERAQKTQLENLDKNGEPKNKDFNDVWNANERKSFRVNMKPGNNFNLTVSPQGNIRAEVYNKSTGQVGSNQQLYPSDLSASGTATEKLNSLLKKVNSNQKSVSSELTVSISNFTTSVEIGSNINEMLENLSTKLKPSIRGGSYLYIGASNAAIQAERDKALNISNIPVKETMSDAEMKRQAKMDALGSRLTNEEDIISNESFAAFTNNPAVLTVEVINAIAEKIMSGQKLTPREQAVRQEPSIAPRVEEYLNATLSSEQKENVDLTQLAQSPIDQLNARMKEIEVEVKKEVGPRGLSKALKTNDVYQKLKKQIEKLAKPGNKILPAGLLSNDVEDINIFLDWAAANLPEFISIGDINQLGNNLKAGGVRVGAFALDLSGIAAGVSARGTIYTGATNAFRYHEAFHGVFRMLLSSEEQKKLLRIAKKEKRAELRRQGLSFEKELQRFQNSADTYSEMNKEQLEKEYYEEYLADQFELFKTGPKNTKTDSVVKSFFTKVLDWIKSVFNSYSKNELRTLFENIDSGKYSQAGVITNDFTIYNSAINDILSGVTIANALVPYEIQTVNGRKGKLYLDGSIANNLVRTMGQMYIIEKRNSNSTKDEIMEDLMLDFEWLYNPENPINNKFTNPIVESDGLLFKKLQELFSGLAYSNTFEKVSESPIYKAVFDILDIVALQAEIQEENNEQYENQDGLRNVTQYGKEAYMSGGFSSLPTWVRSYLSTITKEETDIFGNEFLSPNRKLVVPIDVFSTYNGLLKSVKNLEDPLQILQSMYLFSLSNSNTKIVVERMFNDIGIPFGENISEVTIPQNPKDPTLFNQITKAFTNFKVEWLFQQKDTKDNVITYSAAERDDVNTQTDMWAQAYISLEQMWKLKPKQRDEAVKSLENLTSILSDSSRVLEDAELKSLSEKYAENLFDKTGIKLSPLYIQFSIVSSKDKSLVKDNQLLLMNFNKEAKAVTASDSYFISQIIKNNNDLFSEKAGARSRLKKMAINNAIFDESIGLSVFTNINGDMVNAHQKPTFHLKRIAALNDLSEIDRLMLEPYLRSNYLLNNEAFIEMTNQRLHNIKRVSGTKVVETLDRDVDFDSYIDGVLNTTEYGSYTAKQFLLNMINNYTLDFNTKNSKLKSEITIEEISGKEKRVATSPVLIRVLESANTADLKSLPVIKAVEFKNNKVQITQEVLDIMYDFVENEYNRIVREQGEERTIDEIEGYNTNEMRGNQMINSEFILSSDIKSKLEASALSANPSSFSKALSDANYTKKKFDNLLNDLLENKFTRFESLIDSLEIGDQITKDITEGIVGNKKGDNRTNSIISAEALNLRNDKNYNLKQLFFNDYINTKSINEILLGDQSRILENAIKKIKRAKGQNAAFDNVYSPLSDPSKGVMHPTENINVVTFNEENTQLPSSFTGKTIDRADGQLYITTKAFRHFWFGLGKLTQSQADIITKIESGQLIDGVDIFGGVKDGKKVSGLVNQNGMLNSKKFVHFDGESFLKMSAFVLTPAWTSVDTGDRLIVNGVEKIQWKANPLRPSLHKLRMDLEKLEADNNTVSIAGPQSAFKMLKKNVKDLSENIDAPSNIINARDFGLQVINPSNKNQITELSQIKAIVTSEQKDSVKVPGLLDASGNVMDVGRIKQDYNTALKRRIVLKFKNKRNLIFTFEGLMSEFNVSRGRNKLTPNLSSFLQYATNSLKASQSSSNLLEFFSIDPETGEPKYELNNPVAIAKAEQLFLSYFNKGVFQEKIPGHGIALVSDFGNNIYRKVYSIQVDKDNKVTPYRSEVIREANYKGEDTSISLDGLNTGKGIVDKKTGVIQLDKPIVVIDRLRMGLTEFDLQGQPTGQTYSETVLPSHFKEVYDLIEKTGVSIPPAIAKMFGVRIPSQDNHSSINIKLVDFMPVFYGSSGMFPAELVEVSGADFDIDKMYTQIKQWYEQEGKFYEYGQTKGREYNDYVEYVNRNINTDDVYSQAIKSWDLQGSKIEDSYTEAERKQFATLSDDSVKALSRLGLPKSKDEYIKYVKEYGEPYEAPYNNKILDYRYALMGNEGVQDISFQPASLDAIKNAYEYMQRIAPVYTESVSSENIDVDDLEGKTKSFINNKGAAIGKAVSPNLYLSLLTEYEVSLPDEYFLNLVGQTYKGYNTLVDKVNGRRKQDIISALITMLTDNSKENYVSKLGMHPQAVGLATNMVALGVPLDHAVALLNTKIVRDIFEEAANRKTKFEPGFAKLIEDKIAEIQNPKKEKAFKIKVSNNNISEDLLKNAIENTNELTNDEKVDILSQVFKVNTISSFTGKMRSITGISGNGIGKNLSDIQDRIKELEDIGARTGQRDIKSLLDITKILENSWVSSSIDIFNKIADDLIPVTFITGTKVFNNFYDKLSLSLNNKDRSFDSKVISNIKRDMLSYFTIKGYQHNNINNNSVSSGALSNDLIYPNDGYSILDVVKRLKDVTSDNFFLSSFFTELSIDNEFNNTGLNLLQTNTWRKLNKLQKIDVQTSFARLYGNPLTQADAMNIVNYLMVKDGLQIKAGTLLDAISPFVIDNYLEHINNVKTVLLNDRGYESVFGKTKEELYSEFEEGYLTSNVIGPKLFQVTEDVLTKEVRGLKGSTSNDNSVFTSINPNGQTFKYKDQPKYIRVIKTDGLSNNYLTYKIRPLDSKGESSSELNKITYIYDKVETMGSNYQNGIGFMFGPRNTYAEVRLNIKNKVELGITNQEFAGVDNKGIDTEEIKNILSDDATSPQSKALNMDSAIIIATQDNIDFKVDETSKAINIGSTEELAKALDVTPAQQTSEVINRVEENIDEENKGVISAVDNLPELSPGKQQYQLNFTAELKDAYPQLTEFYNNTINAPFRVLEVSEMKKNLEDNNINSLEDLVDLLNNNPNTRWVAKDGLTAEEQMIEEIKKCNL